MIFIVLVVLRSQRGDRYINLPGPPIFFLFHFFFLFNFKTRDPNVFFFLTAPPAAGIPTYISPPPKKQKYGHSFILFGEKKISNFIGYFSCFL